MKLAFHDPYISGRHMFVRPCSGGARVMPVVPMSSINMERKFVSQTTSTVS